jgi:hypothetical protein
MCRSAFWTALRRWGERAIAAGILTIGDIKNGNLEACTLLPRANSPEPIGEAATQFSAIVAPRADSPDARQMAFEQLLARTIAARRR